MSQLRRIPSRRIAAEHGVGRAGYGRFALRADLVRTRIGAVRRRARALIACPVETNRIGVTLVCHELLRPAALGLSQKVKLSGFRSLANGCFGLRASFDASGGDFRYYPERRHSLALHQVTAITAASAIGLSFRPGR